MNCRFHAVFFGEWHRTIVCPQFSPLFSAAPTGVGSHGAWAQAGRRIEGAQIIVLHLRCRPVCCPDEPEKLQTGAFVEIRSDMI